MAAILITLFVVVFFGTSVSVVLSALNSISPIKKTKQPSVLDNFWSKIYSNSINRFLFVLFLAILTVLLIGLVTKQDIFSTPFGEGLFVELFGMLFDIILLGLLFTWITDKGEKEGRVKRLKAEIDICSKMKTEEATNKILLNIYLLNNEGVTDIKIRNVNFDGYDFRDFNFGGTTAKTIDLSGGYLLEVDFSGCSLPDAQFVNVTGSSVKFNTDDAILLRADFSDSHLQYSEFKEARLDSADFRNATLSSVDFSGASLKGTKFINTYIGNCNFENALVNENFLEHLRQSNIQGNQIYEEYELVPKIFPGYTDYRLKRKEIQEEE